MKDLHRIFTQFKKDFPWVHASHESLGKEIQNENRNRHPGALIRILIILNLGLFQ